MHHAILDCYNKDFTYLDEEGNLKIVQGIPRFVTIREVSSFQLKKSIRKIFQVFVADMEEAPKDKVPDIEYYVFLMDFKDGFIEIQWFPPK
jgi:hypothetical protein